MNPKPWGAGKKLGPKVGMSSTTARTGIRVFYLYLLKLPMPCLEFLTTT